MTRAKYPSRIIPLTLRLLSRVEPTETGCLEWRGSLGPNGYGKIRIGQKSAGTGKTVNVHRLAYTHFRGPIPKGLDLDHLCRNRACINPDHLEPVTRRENIMRGLGPALLAKVQGDKTHCSRGHKFSPENTIHRPTGGRRCRLCERDNSKRGNERAKRKRKAQD